MTDIDRIAYPFTSNWARLRDGRMHYVDEGAGEPIVFVHGTPTWSFEWRHVIRALSPTSRCIAPDHLGFGLSDRPWIAPYSPEWHSENFAEFVEALNPPPFTLVVHDFGGPIALPIALHQPQRVKRLVIVNSWMWSFAGDRDMEGKARIAGSAFGKFMYRWANMSLRVIAPSAYGDRSKLTPQIHRQYLERFPDRWSRGAVLWPLAKALLGSSEFYESMWRERATLAGRPTLIVWGMKDSAFKPHQLARWKEALPSARVVEVPGAGHWPHEEQPEQVSQGLREFLQGA
ncbi:MAG: alpha/beta fold hydrolase [Gemmatimonadaceae bacterium]